MPRPNILQNISEWEIIPRRRQTGLSEVIGKSRPIAESQCFAETPECHLPIPRLGAAEEDLRCCSTWRSSSGSLGSTMPCFDEPIVPMTLGNMRSRGVRWLFVTCRTCGHETEVNADA
jgi:hypothetical protein